MERGLGSERYHDVHDNYKCATFTYDKDNCIIIMYDKIDKYTCASGQIRIIHEPELRPFGDDFPY